MAHVPRPEGFGRLFGGPAISPYVPSSMRFPAAPNGTSPTRNTGMLPGALELERLIAAQEDAVYGELSAVDAALETLRLRGLNNSASLPSNGSDGQRSRSAPRQPSPYTCRYTSPTTWYRTATSPHRRVSPRSVALVVDPPRDCTAPERAPCARLAAAMPAWKTLAISPSAPHWPPDHRMPHMVGPHLTLRCLNCRNPQGTHTAPRLRQSSRQNGSPPKEAKAKRKKAPTVRTHIEADLNRLLVQSQQINRTLEDVRRLEGTSPPRQPGEETAGGGSPFGAGLWERDDYFRRLALQSEQIKQNINHQLGLFEQLQSRYRVASTSGGPLCASATSAAAPLSGGGTTSKELDELRAEQLALQARLVQLLGGAAEPPAPLRLHCSLLPDGTVLPASAGTPATIYGMLPRSGSGDHSSGATQAYDGTEAVRPPGPILGTTPDASIPPPTNDLPVTTRSDGATSAGLPSAPGHVLQSYHAPSPQCGRATPTSAPARHSQSPEHADSQRAGGPSQDATRPSSA